jgi:hypothetical protein
MGRDSMSLRRSVQGERKKKGAKGWGGNWRDRMNIPKAEFTPILLCRAEYEDTRPDSIKDNDGEIPLKHYHVHPNHTIKDNNLFRKLRCAGGWEGHDADCLCCYRKKNGDKRVGFPRDVFSMNILHLALYQKQPLKDKDGKPRRFENDDPEGGHRRGDPIMGWTEVTRARDKKDVLVNIEDLLEDGSVSMARKKYVEVGSGHLQNLMLINDKAEKICACSGKLEPVAFFCEKCDETICDVEEANMTAEERDQYAMERQRCDSCGHFGFPENEHVCDECDEPEPLSAFDVVAWVKKTGEGTATTITIDRVEALADFEFPDGSSLYQWDDDEDNFVEDDDGNYVLYEDYEKLIGNQFNFDKVHQASDSDYIAKLLGCENPFGSKGGARGYAKSSSRFRDDDGDGKGKDDDDGDEKPRRGRARTKRGRGRGGRR